jgi:hypothetical protein
MEILDKTNKTGALRALLSMFYFALSSYAFF